MSSAPGFLRVTTAWAALTFVAALAALLTAPSLLGYRTLTVLSGSMTPTLDVGGIVVDEAIQPTEARVGDIVTFPNPDQPDDLITHRLKRVTVRDGKAYMVTQGDANNTAERWNVPVGEEIGRVAYHVPMLGYVRTWLSGRAGRLGAVAAMVLVLGLVLIDIWRPARPGGAEVAK
jgi:signal peptidase